MKKISVGFMLTQTAQINLPRKLFLKNNPVLKEKMGKMSRKLAEEKYDKNILCAKFTNIIKKIENVQKLP